MTLAPPPPGDGPPPAALYVHLPFCARRCPYCDFATADLSAALEARYLDALEAEARARLPAGFAPRTVYLGGGTPAELTTAGIARLVAWLGPLARGAAEVTLEANPRTLLPRKLRALRAGLGVDRVSLGAQSFQPRLLAALGRVHRPEDVPRAVALARAEGVAQVSLDLMFGAPGQTLAEVDLDLDAALALAPDHLSVYCLTWEEGTPYALARDRGALRPRSAGWEARAYARVRARLRAAGFVHYEVSSFARPGRHARHNTVYWRSLPFVGLGNGAASLLDGARLTNVRDPAAYADAVLARGGAAAVAEVEVLPPARRLREAAWLALRTSHGLEPARLRADAGLDPAPLAADLERLAGWGLLARRGARWVLTGRGVTLADAVGRELLREGDAEGPPG